MFIKATWKELILAQSDNFKIVEGRYYFPPESVSQEYMEKNGNKHVSRWKGTADYYDIVTENEILKDAALVYHTTEKEVESINGFFSFSNEVEIAKT